MRIYIINGVGRIFCFNFNNEIKIIDNNLKYKQKSKTESNQKNHICKSEKSINNLKNKFEDYKLKVHLEDEFEFKSSYTLKKYSKNSKKMKSISFHELSCNLEIMLMKLQKCFNPNLLKDEELKFAIIKEIIECQRLLLVKTMRENTSESFLSINDIYDEWKILAMIIDRICFFFYLSALILSSTIFFVREKAEQSDY